MLLAAGDDNNNDDDDDNDNAPIETGSAEEVAATDGLVDQAAGSPSDTLSADVADANAADGPSVWPSKLHAGGGMEPGVNAGLVVIGREDRSLMLDRKWA